MAKYYVQYFYVVAKILRSFQNINFYIETLELIKVFSYVTNCMHHKDGRDYIGYYFMITVHVETLRFPEIPK